MASASGSGGPGRPAKASGSGGPPPPPRQERLVNELASDLKQLLGKVKKSFSAVMGKKPITKENLEKEIKKAQQELKEMEGKGKKVAPKGLLKRTDSQGIRDVLDACPSQDSQELDSDDGRGVQTPGPSSDLSIDPNEYCSVFRPPGTFQPGPVSVPGVEPLRLPEGAQEG